MSGSQAKPFLTDVKTLRERARKNMESGVVTSTYGGDVNKTIEILQAVLATEIVCVLRYTVHAVTATGIASESVKAEFAQHAKEEQDHMMRVAERIDQLGGKPNFNPEGLATRSASQYS
ncbi:MAG TPA: ferritin-like domain-containing protein, partial [Rhodopila sp.]|nr:ferritin-like domain-containing protein [Rhodopila sp.]